MLIDISKGIKVGGYDITVDLSEESRRDGVANDRYGCWSATRHLIRIDPSFDKATTSETFIHEVIEAVNHIYCADKVEHDHITQLSYGIHQVFESLGVQFGKGGK